MKVAVTGKGGVGKSTIVALFARILRDQGKRVIVIDADPDMNAATILGISNSETLTPIVELKELIAERTGTEVGQPAPFFKMNPRVDDIPDKYCVEQDGIKLLVMGTIKRGGGGCACPENAFLKSLLSHLVINREEWVLLDMEAGIEHLGRGTALGVDEMIVVVEASKASLETAHRIKALSKDIGVRNLRVIGNRIQNPAEEEYLSRELDGFSVLGYLRYSDEIRSINLGEKTALTIEGDALEQVKTIVEGWE
jgi:CO dehydrogenase maturation factor